MAAPTVWKADDFVGRPSFAGTNGRDLSLSADASGRLLIAFTRESTAGDPNFFYSIADTARAGLSQGGGALTQTGIDEQMVSGDGFANGMFRAWAWTEKDDATGNYDIYARVVTPSAAASGAASW
jgi:hypothetical protein